MRNRFFAFVVIVGLSLAGCDLLNQEVLIDENVKTTVTDSTTIRLMNSVPDSTQLIINTEALWHASVSKGGEWCKLSKYDGRKGRDTLCIFVDENTETMPRQTSIVVESGTLIMIFKVNQSAAETWLDITYWKRTALQRMGLHGSIKQITVTDNRSSMESSIYDFDEFGNLISHQSIDKIANKYDTTRTYTYDDAGHRVACTVTEDVNNTVVRKWQYRYENMGKLVAYSPKGWTDPNPLAEDMEGMIVPDLSYVYKTWVKGEKEFYEKREYTFDGDRLLIHVKSEMIKDGDADWIVPLVDTVMRVSYQYFNTCGQSLPYTSRNNVTNTTYYANGMLKMMRTVNSAYDFLDNVQRMVVVSYAYYGEPGTPHEIDSYECEYNTNRDLTERRIRYSGSSDVTVERYPQYQYDDRHNWNARVVEITRPGYSQPVQNATKRDIIYY